MKINKLTVFLILAFLASNVWAFESETIQFSHPSDRSNAVSVVFNGKVFRPGLNVLNPKGIVKDAELKRFHVFFKKLYENNRQGNPESVLSIWSPKDRETIRSAMDDESIAKNKTLFESITAIKIKVIIQFGGFYICLVELSMQGQTPFVMKYPVTEHQGELVLSNGLNGDYFYELMSHYLDETNFRALLNERE